MGCEVAKSCVHVVFPPLLNLVLNITFSLWRVLLAIKNPPMIIFLFSALQIAKLLQSLANRHVVGSHFKEEYMQPLQSFAMAHVDDVQVSIPCQVERVVCGHSSLFGTCQRTVSREN